MSVDRYIDQSSAWVPHEADGGIVISSRVRLARNVADTPFPGWAGEEECVRIFESLQPVWSMCPGLANAHCFDMGNLNTLDKQILFERHLISREQAERQAGSGVVIRPDEALSVMINEEDHLRVQSMRAGLAVQEAWEAANTLDSEIEEHVHYAFSPQLGYLTACPSNVGTGMRASVMLHTPGLVLMKEIGAVVKGMAKIGLAVRGLWGEGSEASGNMFQVSNQMTLGENEAQIVNNLVQIVQEIVEHEQNARWRMFEQNEALLRDQTGRALGILANAHVLTSKEALDLMSDLRLGIDMGIVPISDQRVTNDLLVLLQPGHMQKASKRRLQPAERDITRAGLVRRRITKALNKESEQS